MILKEILKYFRVLGTERILHGVLQPWYVCGAKIYYDYVTHIEKHEKGSVENILTYETTYFITYDLFCFSFEKQIKKKFVKLFLKIPFVTVSGIHKYRDDTVRKYCSFYDLNWRSSRNIQLYNHAVYILLLSDRKKLVHILQSYLILNRKLNR